MQNLYKCVNILTESEEVTCNSRTNSNSWFEKYGLKIMSDFIICSDLSLILINRRRKRVALEGESWSQSTKAHNSCSIATQLCTILLLVMLCYCVCLSVCLFVDMLQSVHLHYAYL